MERRDIGEPNQEGDLRERRLSTREMTLREGKTGLVDDLLERPTFLFELPS